MMFDTPSINHGGCKGLDNIFGTIEWVEDEGDEVFWDGDGRMVGLESGFDRDTV